MIKKLMIALSVLSLCSCVTWQTGLEEDKGPPSMPRPKQITSAEITAGTESDLRSYAPDDIVSLISTHGVGVTNGDSHDHNGGDGAQIDHTTLSNIGNRTHAQIDTFATALDGDGDGDPFDQTWYTTLYWSGGTDVPILDGGTGASTVSAARTNLGVPALAGESGYTGAHDFSGGTIEIPSGTSLPGTCSVGMQFLDTDADTDGSLYTCVATDTWKEVDDDGSAGGISSVLGDSSGDVPVLFQTWSAFTASDTTPDVSTFSLGRSVDTTTINDFDGTPVDGQVLYVYCGAATVFDFTSSGLEAWNRSTDLTCTVGQILAFKYRDTQWYCQNCPDEFETLSSDGIVVNSSGTPYARTLQSTSGGGFDWTNGDGVSGNPTPAFDLAPSSGSATIIEEEDALQVKYNAADFDEGANGLYQDYTNGQKASITQPGYVTEMATAAETTTGTDAARAVSPDGLAGSVYGQKEIGWTIHDSDASTAVADGKQAAVIPASMNGMELQDVTCSIADQNSATGGATTVVLRRVRAGTPQDMTSTGVTISYNEYTASDEAVDTSYDDVQTGDNIYVDINAVTTGAVHLGLSCTAVFQTP